MDGTILSEKGLKSSVSRVSGDVDGKVREGGDGGGGHEGVVGEVEVAKGG